MLLESAGLPRSVLKVHRMVVIFLIAFFFLPAYFVLKGYIKLWQCIIVDNMSLGIEIVHHRAFSMATTFFEKKHYGIV